MPELPPSHATEGQPSSRSPAEAGRTGTKTRERDEERRRATYGLRYPLAELHLSGRADVEAIPRVRPDDARRTLSERRLTFDLRNKTIDRVVFKECNFHDRKGKSTAEITSLTFRGCVFKYCIMGTTRYSRVRFEQCEFLKCDFVNAEFVECTFEECSFSQCTGESIWFVATLISPDDFLSGLEAPVYNFESADPSVIRDLRRSWREVRFRVAASIFASVATLADGNAADAALRHVKRERCFLDLDRWRFGDGARLTGMSRVKLLVRNMFDWTNLVVTGGGTSLMRTVVVLFFLVAANALWLIRDPIPFAASPVDGPCGALLASASAVFGFGATFFQPRTPYELMRVALPAVVGIVWMGFALPVLVRRIHR